MKNLIYNIVLFIFGFIQTLVAVWAIGLTAMVDDNNLILVVIMWIALVGLAFADKFIRKIEGWLPLPLCFIVAPLRGIIQFVILILTIANLCRRAAPVCKRGKYNEYRFLSTVIYVATGLNVSKQASAAEQAAAKARLEEIQRNHAEKPKSKREQLHDELLSQDPHYFDLGRSLKKYMPIAGHLSNSSAGIRDESVEISYNDTYTEMQISYSAEIYPNNSDRKTVRAAWKHYYNACLDLQRIVNRTASSHIQGFIKDYPFKGKVKWRVNVTICKVDL